MADEYLMNGEEAVMSASRSPATCRQKLLNYVSLHEDEKAQHSTKSKSHGREDVTSTSGPSKILELPNELVQEIMSYIDGMDLGPLRLMSRRFAILGAPGLFKDGFSIRPHREDMLRLARVCLIPEIAQGIQTIKIYMGDMNPHQFLSAIQGSNVNTRSMPQDILRALKRLMDPNSDHLDREILEACFAQLQNVEVIQTESYDAPFYDGNWAHMEGLSNKSRIAWMGLDSAWDYMSESHDEFDRSHFLSSGICSKRIENLFLAVAQLPVPLKTLSLDAVTLDMFASGLGHLQYDVNFEPVLPIPVDKQKLQRLYSAVQKLEGLELSIVGSGIFHMVYTGAPLARALSGFFGAMQNLRQLSFDWTIEEEFDVDFATAFDQSFFNLRFLHLEDLQLGNLCSPRGVIIPFILGHSATLKRLGWSPNYTEGDDGGDDLWQTELSTQITDDQSWRDQFTKLRDCMPHLVACDIADLYTGSANAEPLYNGDWTRTELSPRHRVSTLLLLEYYILGKMPWPMKKDNPHLFKGWLPKHTTTNKEFMQYSPETLAEIYSDEWETDNEDGDEIVVVSDPEDDDEDEDEDEDEDTDEDEDMDSFTYETHAGPFSDFEEAHMGDVDFDDLSEVMQHMIPPYLDSHIAQNADEWEDQDEDDDDGDDDEMDETDGYLEDEGDEVPDAIVMDALSNQLFQDNIMDHMYRYGNDPLGTSRPRNHVKDFEDFKAAIGYKTNKDDL